MDAVRYFRGLGPVRKRRTERFVLALCVLALIVLTVVVAIAELG